MSPVPLRRPSAAPAPAPELLGALLDCHGRIRACCAGLERLGRHPEPRAELARRSAAELHRYLSLALPLHAEDEDRSIAPRLREAAPQLAPLLDELEEQHAAMEEARAALLVELAAWSEGRPGPAPILRARAEALCAPLLEHIEREEAELFPALARLPEADQQSILGELRRRRAP